MSRFIMLSLVGILTVFLILNFIAVVGLNSFTNVLEKNIMVGHVNADIDFLNFQLNQCDTNLQLCKNLNGEVLGLQKMKLQKKSSRENMKVSSLQAAKASYNMAMCYREKTKDCVETPIKNCIPESLLSYVESLAISSRHLKIEFNKEEQVIYRRIVALKGNTADGEEPMTVAVEALPVLARSMERLNELPFVVQ